MVTPFEHAWTFLKADLSNIISQRPQGDKDRAGRNNAMGAWQTMHPAVQRYPPGKVSLPGLENNGRNLLEPDIGRNTQFPASDTSFSISSNQTEGMPEPLGDRDSPHRNLEYMAEFGDEDRHRPTERLKQNQQAYQQFQQQQQQKPIEQGLPQMNPNVMQQM